LTVEPAVRLVEALADRYAIERALGAGGMATVYLAHDLKHERQVAIKVLRPELAAVLGAERFVQEIKTTAALSHPHILPLFDSGEAGGFLYYVMPYLHGETIREKLNREAQLGIDEAVRIAAEVADALDHAHRHGVIHRDIKPENILLYDGRAMVMDFGIALAVSAAAGGRMTETGLSLGTPHYMSPEQATADRDLTARSDIYSLASVLYEMLSGEPPHLGTSAQQIIMKIVTEEAAPVTRLRKSVPPNVAAALAKALEKLPADRFETAKAFAEALENPAFLPSGLGLRAGGVQSPPWKRIAIIAGTVAVGSLVAAIAGWMRPQPQGTSASVRFTESLDSARIASPGARRSMQSIAAVEVSRDGRAIVLQDDGNRNWLRRLDREGYADVAQGANPRLSADGLALAVVDDNGSLLVQSVDGGPRTKLGDLPVSTIDPYLAWGDDGFIYVEMPQLAVVGEGGTVLRYRADGSAPPDTVRLSPSIGEGNRSQVRVVPQVVLPGGTVLVYSVVVGGGAVTLWAQPIGGGEAHPLGASASPRGAMWDAEHQRLLVARDGSLLAIRIDTRTGVPQGPAVALLALPGTGTMVGYGGGTLALVSAGVGANRILLADRKGNLREIQGFPPDTAADAPAVSPDGRRFALTMGGFHDVFVFEMPAGPLVQVTRTGGGPMAWMPDGKSLLFAKGTDIYRVRSDGDQEPELVLHRSEPLVRVAVDPTGQRVYFQALGNDWDIGSFTLGLAGSDTLFLNTPAREGHPSVSPDGKWLAYYAETRGTQVFIRPTVGTGPRVQVSREGAVYPRFSRDGRHLFFQQRVGLGLLDATLEVTRDGGIGVAKIEELPLAPVRNAFDVFPGDSLFVVVGSPSKGAQPQVQSLTVITNFTAQATSTEGGR